MRTIERAIAVRERPRDRPHLRAPGPRRERLHPGASWRESGTTWRQPGVGRPAARTAKRAKSAS